MVKRLEENSGHPIAKAMVNFCGQRTNHTYVPTNMEEIPGKGMFGEFRLDIGGGESLDVQVIVGNERLMYDHNVMISPQDTSTLQFWKRAGNSVVLVAIRAINPLGQTDGPGSEWQLSLLFAIADQLRPESKEGKCFL